MSWVAITLIVGILIIFCAMMSAYSQGYKKGYTDGYKEATLLGTVFTVKRGNMKAKVERGGGFW